jgi:hypothetical protein
MEGVIALQYWRSCIDSEYYSRSSPSSNTENVTLLLIHNIWNLIFFSIIIVKFSNKT